MCRGQYTSVIQSIAVQIDYYAAVLWVEYISLTGGYNHGYTQLYLCTPKYSPKLQFRSEHCYYPVDLGVPYFPKNPHK